MVQPLLAPFQFGALAADDVGQFFGTGQEVFRSGFASCLGLGGWVVRSLIDRGVAMVGDSPRGILVLGMSRIDTQHAPVKRDRLTDFLALAFDLVAPLAARQAVQSPLDTARCARRSSSERIIVRRVRVRRHGSHSGVLSSRTSRHLKSCHTTHLQRCVILDSGHRRNREIPEGAMPLTAIAPTSGLPARRPPRRPLTSEKTVDFHEDQGRASPRIPAHPASSFNPAERSAPGMSEGMTGGKEAS